MTKIKLEIPSVGEKNVVAEPKVDTALKKVEEFLNEKNIETTDNLKAGGIAEASLSTALQEKLTTKIGLTYVKKAGSFEGVSENFYQMETNGATLTLPAPTNNRMIGCFATVGVSCKVTASSGKIYGDFITGSTTVELLEWQHIIVEANGSNWVIIAGEPKREQKYEQKTYTKAEMEAGVVFNATRPVFAVNEYTGALRPLTVGGQQVIYSIAMKVPAGQVVKATGPFEAATIQFSILVE